MLAYIPAFIGVTLAIGFAVAPQRNDIETSIARTTSTNMIMQHRASFDLAKTEFRPSGNYDTSLAGPFDNLSDWNSREVIGDGRKLLVTWPGTEGRIDDYNSVRAIGFIDPSRISGIPDTQAGRFEIEDGSITVNNVDFSDIDLPIVDGTPVIVTDLGPYNPGVPVAPPSDALIGENPDGSLGELANVSLTGTGAVAGDTLNNITGPLLGTTALGDTVSDVTAGLGQTAEETINALIPVDIPVVGGLTDVVGGGLGGVNGILNGGQGGITGNSGLVGGLTSNPVVGGVTGVVGGATGGLVGGLTGGLLGGGQQTSQATCRPTLFRRCS